MNLRHEMITDKDKLKLYRDDILSLYEQCFEKAISVDLWNWQYIANPIGDSVVSLCFDGDVLVGHYGAIQYPVLFKGEEHLALLSTGSMVLSTYRKYGVFVNQGNQIYEDDWVKDKFLLVMGFPNKLALPSRKKRLKWSINEDDFVALVTKKDLENNSEFIDSLYSEKDVTLNLEEDSFLEWRLSKPFCNYQKKPFLISKLFSNSIDLLCTKKGFLDDLDSNNRYYILCDGADISMREFKSFDYPFGYRFLSDLNVHCSFRKELIMSDVF